MAQHKKSSASNPPAEAQGPQQPPVLPQLVDHGRPCKEFQYAAKVVSGIPQPDDGQEIVAPGRYYTAINVHNPATCKTVTFRWKVAVANPLVPGVITRFFSLTLRPDQAVEIDSPNIAKALGVAATRFVKGYVVIESPCELDVVAVYTVGAPATHGTPVGNVVAFHTERVCRRLIEACRDDLKLDLSTGATEWTLTSAVNYLNQPLPIQTPRPANVIETVDKSAVWGSQPGAQWISVRSVTQNLNPPTGPGFFTFQRCFSLCSGFENARLQLSVLVDDSATIWLNNTQVSTAAGFNNPTPVSITNQSLFLPGLNCLSFVVKNIIWLPETQNPVGLNVVGTVTAERGACPDCGCCCSDCGAQQVYPKPHPNPVPSPTETETEQG
ncbi:MAG: hypothetical protein JF614_04080 [Acidobacteria bacterium]|nr:hypothetical protein [Acidobacteriota bacterium]